MCVLIYHGRLLTHSRPHRKLEDKNGIFTFVAFGRKEGGAKIGTSLGVYFTPELYETPRL